MKNLFVLCIVFLFATSCAQSIPKGNPDRFDNAFFTACPEGYKMEFIGRCDSDRCPTECVKEKGKHRYAYVGDDGKLVISETPPPPTVEIPIEIEEGINDVAWRVDTIDGSAEAAYNNMPMMVYITSNGECSPCRKMDRTFEDQRVVKLLNDKFVSVKLTIYEADKAGFNVSGYPETCFVFVDDENKTSERVGTISGFVSPEKFIDSLNKVLDVKPTVAKQVAIEKEVKRVAAEKAAIEKQLLEKEQALGLVTPDLADYKRNSSKMFDYSNPADGLLETRSKLYINKDDPNKRLYSFRVERAGRYEYAWTIVGNWAGREDDTENNYTIVDTNCNNVFDVKHPVMKKGTFTIPKCEDIE